MLGMMKPMLKRVTKKTKANLVKTVIPLKSVVNILEGVSRD